MQRLSPDRTDALTQDALTQATLAAVEQFNQAFNRSAVDAVDEYRLPLRKHMAAA